MDAVVYARYSSEDQRTESITAQVRACQEYANKHGISISKVYADEAVSGKGSKTSKRIQYQKMLRDVEANPCDFVLIHKYDRIARNVQEHVNLASRLNALDIELIAVGQDYGSSKEAKLLKVLSWAMSELYIDNLADEVRKGHRETALQGKHNGGVPPFGYDVVNQEYVINELEAFFVRRMFSACVNGEKYTALLDEMAAAGIKGKRGRPMSYPSIYEILRNEKYTGVYIYSVQEEKSRESRRKKPNAIRVENAIPAIVDRETWERVQKIMDNNKNNGRTPKAEYLLSGIIYCGECGAPMYGHTTRREKNGVNYEYSRYYCSEKCGNKGIKAEDVENAVYRYLREFLTPENRDLLYNTLLKYKRQAEAVFAIDEDYTKKEIADRQKQVDALMGNMRAAVLPPSVLEAMGKEIEQLQDQIGILQAQICKPLTLSKPEVMSYFDAISNLEHQSAKARRDTVRHFIERVEVKANAVDVHSTFTAFVESIGCGGRI